MSFVPLPPWGKRSLHIRADMRYADDDFTLWAQPYHIKYPHLGAVPKKPKDLADPLSIMWWTPTADDFELAVGDQETGLGFIAASQRAQLDQLVDPLIIRIENYREVVERPNSFMLIIAKLLKHAQVRLNTLPAKFFDAKFGFVKLQHLYLEASGCIDYLETFVPIVDWKLPAAIQVDESRMGTFTPDPETVQSFCRAGLPVWYIRRFDEIPTRNPPNVLALVDALQPTNLVLSPSDPPFPVIYEGTDNLKKQDMIRIFSKAQMFYHDPFSDEKAPSYAGAPCLPSVSTAVSVNSSARRPWSASSSSSFQPSSSSSSQPSQCQSRVQKQGKGVPSFFALI